VFLGVAWMGVSSLFRTNWTSDADFFSLLWPMMAQGIGIPMMMIPLTTMALSSVEPAETASASGLQNFARTMSTALATSMVLTIWGNAQASARANLVGNLHEGPTRATLSQLGMGPLQSSAMIEQMVQKEAVTLAVNHVFWVAAAISFLAASLVWLIPRVPLTRLTGPPPAAH